VLVGADLVQAAADEGPADAPDGERDFADGDDVADGQFPGRFSGVAAPWLEPDNGKATTNDFELREFVATTQILRALDMRDQGSGHGPLARRGF
jgi:hypothetical protein